LGNAARKRIGAGFVTKDSGGRHGVPPQDVCLQIVRRSQ
jgi:hypothetical protein